MAGSLAGIAQIPYAEAQVVGTPKDVLVNGEVEGAPGPDNGFTVYGPDSDPTGPVLGPIGESGQGIDAIPLNEFPNANSARFARIYVAAQRSVHFSEVQSFGFKYKAAPTDAAAITWKIGMFLDDPNTASSPDYCLITSPLAPTAPSSAAFVAQSFGQSQTYSISQSAPTSPCWGSPVVASNQALSTLEAAPTFSNLLVTDVFLQVDAAVDGAKWTGGSVILDRFVLMATASVSATPDFLAQYTFLPVLRSSAGPPALEAFDFSTGPVKVSVSLFDDAGNRRYYLPEDPEAGLPDANLVFEPATYSTGAPPACTKMFPFDPSDGNADHTAVFFVDKAILAACSAVITWNIKVVGLNEKDSSGTAKASYYNSNGQTAFTGKNYQQAASLDAQGTGIAMGLPGITVTPNGAALAPLGTLDTSEIAGDSEDSFDVVLDAQPANTITVTATSDRTLECNVKSGAAVAAVSVPLSFTQANWNLAQTVKLVGVDDNVVDGSQICSVTVAVTSNTDPAYNGKSGPTQTVTNHDDDAAGFTITPTTGLITTEAGGTATFTMKLTSQPTANVNIGLSSSKPAEGTVSPASLLFTASTWSNAQTVTLTGVDDLVDDGDLAYSTVTAADAATTDANYRNLNPVDVSATNTDNDNSGFTVTPTSGLTTTEAGGAATFTVKLTSQPTANVNVGLSSSNAAEGTVSPATLPFAPGNWNVAQTVTITGQDDLVDDGNIAYTIVTAADSATSDATYNGLNPADVTVTNNDNDSSGFVVTPTSGLVTTEAGASATFTMKLVSQPTAPVTIGISSANNAEGTASPTTLTFNAANWNAPQTVTVTGVDDFVDDGNIAYTIVTAKDTTTTDPTYVNLDPSDVAVSNTDDDTRGITVTPTLGLVTTEAGGSATFTIRLDSQPTAPVIVGMTSSNTAEGTVSPASLTFTAANWNVAALVTVTGVDDSIDDGAVNYKIVTAADTTTADANYNGLNPSDVAVSNTDDDTFGISVIAIPGLLTAENGATDRFDVVLNSQPLSNVIVPIASTDASEGTASPTTLTFTPANWNTAQTVTVAGVDDGVDDGDVAFSVTVGPSTGDAQYLGSIGTTVQMTNLDDEAPVINAAIPAAALEGTFGVSTISFKVTMSVASNQVVTVDFATSNLTARAGADYVAKMGTLTFAPGEVSKIVNITVVTDGVDENNEAFAFTLSNVAGGMASGQATIGVAVVTGTIVDDDTVGITVTPTSGLTTTEAGTSTSFAVWLDSQPSANVSIQLSSSDPSEAALGVFNLTFNRTNWHIAQTVSVTGIDDSQFDGDVLFAVQLSNSSSTDPTYNGIVLPSVRGVNFDNDVNSVPVADFTTGSGSAIVGHPVSFSDASYDVDGPITSWHWDFGDGQQSESRSPQHTYESPGTFIVRLAVLDGSSASTTVTKSIPVFDPTYLQPLAAPAQQPTTASPNTANGGSAPQFATQPDPTPDPSSPVSPSPKAAPLAVAGGSQYASFGDRVQLSAQGSAAAGTGSLNFSWAQVSGPHVDLENASSMLTTFSVPAHAEGASLVFRVNVTDGQAWANATVVVVVKAKPSMSAPIAPVVGQPRISRLAKTSRGAPGLDAGLVALTMLGLALARRRR